MIQSSDDINIETAEPEPESQTQIPESKNTEEGPRTQIQGLNNNFLVYHNLFFFFNRFFIIVHKHG